MSYTAIGSGSITLNAMSAEKQKNLQEALMNRYDRLRTADLAQCGDDMAYQMTDILPLLPIPQPPHGRSAYNIPCPLCDRPGTREKHLNINLKRNVYRCPKCGQFQGGVFDLYAYYMGIPRDKVLEDIAP